MFLDKVWETYSTPYATIFKKWKVKRSKSKIEEKVKEFEEKYSSHPFSMAGSLEYQKLQFLDQLIEYWMDNNTQANEDNTENNTVC